MTQKEFEQAMYDYDCDPAGAAHGLGATWVRSGFALTLVRFPNGAHAVVTGSPYALRREGLQRAIRWYEPGKPVNFCNVDVKTELAQKIRYERDILARPTRTRARRGITKEGRTRAQARLRALEEALALILGQETNTPGDLGFQRFEINRLVDAESGK